MYVYMFIYLHYTFFGIGNVENHEVAELQIQRIRFMFMEHMS